MMICLVGERLNDQSIIINREVPIESPDVVYSCERVMPSVAA